MADSEGLSSVSSSEKGPESGANPEVKVEDDTVNDASDEEVPREVETGECSNKLESEGAAGSSGGGGEPAGQESDPYFYTKLDNFTSEIYKIELQNLPNPKKISYKNFKDMLTGRLNFKPVKAKLVPWSNHAYVTFRNEGERQVALSSLNGMVWKGRTLVAKPAKPIQDPVIAKRNKEKDRKRTMEAAASANAKRSKLDADGQEDGLALSVKLNHTITPLWDQPYPEQIKIKQQVIMGFLKKLTKKLHRIMVLKDNWVAEESLKRLGICCEVLACVPSPTLDGYRNKCEFTIAEGPNKEKTIGFRLGSYKEGHSGVVEPSECVHTSALSKTVVKAFQTYIRESPLEAFDFCFQKGYWQTLTVRTTEVGTSMAIVQFNPQNLTQNELQLEQDKIVKFFTEGEGKDVGLTSLYLQINRTRAIGGRAEAPYTHVMGEKYVYEMMGGLKFRISPDAFFQVNTRAAEKLFDVIKELCGEGLDQTTVLDICCGTGTIGLSVAKSVKRLIGIEITESAVEDAKVNAELNDIQNADFVLGKAEDVIEDVFLALPPKTKVVGILDPPRAGIHTSVIHAIRKCKKIDKLIYVSCNANAASDNFLDLCRPTSKRQRTAPFKLEKAIPLDLFPHTKLCELVMLFTRDVAALEADKYYKWFY